MTTTNTASASNVREGRARPDWIAKSPRGRREKSALERVGAAWTREDGGICLRLYGMQIVSADIYLYPVDAAGDDPVR